MDTMFGSLIATVILVALIAIVVLIPIVIVLIGSHRKRRARRWALLADSSTRLKALVAELLEKVDDYDTQINYIPDFDDNAQKSKLSTVATDLVTVSDCLPTIEQLLNEKRYNDAADMLSASTKVVEKSMRILAQVEPNISMRTLPDGSAKIKIKKDDKAKKKRSS